MIFQTEELLNEINALVNSDVKVKEAIKLEGQVSHQELQPWYNSADFFISGSHYEGGGIALCEAMSCGCIPIVTNIISFRKMTGDGKCGFLYQPGNEKELLEVLLKTREIDMKIESEKTLKQFKEELSFDAIAEKINSIVKSL
jgi:glycosyltransferase involved in cell wall biosynthesis